MYKTSRNSFLVADALGLVQVAGIIFILTVPKEATGRESKEVSAYLPLSDENPEAATKAPA